MICYRDMTFCSDANRCGNHVDCPRWFDEIDAIQAKKWWGKDGAPVAFSSFADSCEKFVEVEK